MVDAQSTPAAPAGPNGTGPQGPPEFFKLEPTLFLEQGDLIPRTSSFVQTTLEQFHPYDVAKESNEMFAVLTQACDLFKRDGVCKARYIVFAPVRPLRLILEKEFKGNLRRTPGNLFVYGSAETQRRYEDFLAKLINNNDSRYFFIPERPELQIAEDMCIQLPLSMAVRIEHYDACLAARVAQLTDLFQAKLGWLLGQQYSRVGTPDWPQSAVDAKVRAVSDRTLSWFPDHEFSQLERLVKKFEADHPNKSLDEAGMASLRKQLKSPRDLAITAVFRVLSKEGHLPPLPNEIYPKLRGLLRSDQEFAKFLPD